MHKDTSQFFHQICWWSKVILDKDRITSNGSNVFVLKPFEFMRAKHTIQRFHWVPKGLSLPGENISSSVPPHAHLSPFLINLFKRISLFWDFNPGSELISEIQGLEEGTGGGGGTKATQLQPYSHNYTHKASRQPINHTPVMPLGKLICVQARDSVM